MNFSSKTLLSFVLMLLFATFASANTIYNINRTIGSGSVLGFLETDGTFGTLSSANLLNWRLTLSSPSLDPDSPQIIEKSNLNIFSPAIYGGGVTASATDLYFNFGATDGSSIKLYSLNEAGTAENFWCLQSAFNCLGGDVAYEAIGFGKEANTAELQYHTGNQSFASVAAVPEPEIYAMMGIGLGLMGWVGRRKRLKESVAG
jgi:hypothetical protein